MKKRRKEMKRMRKRMMMRRRRPSQEIKDRKEKRAQRQNCPECALWRSRLN